MPNPSFSKFDKNDEGMYKLYDRFSFDEFFRSLLINDLNRKEALDFILSNCSLSALVFQERIHNKYYLNISTEEQISDDLIILRNQYLFERFIYRFQLNFSRNVGKVSEEIRKCSPKNKEEWEEYYYKNVRPKEHLIELGRKLHTKITEVLQAEIESITEQDCIEFIINLVISRTFDGYMTERETIYGQLQDILGVKIEPAPDEWDRLYNVDFFIKINDKFIGLQIKPAGGVSHITQIFQEKAQQAKTHEKFTAEYGGKVFYVVSIKENDKKKIHNNEVIEEIKSEIERLKNVNPD